MNAIKRCPECGKYHRPIIEVRDMDKVHKDYGEGDKGKSYSINSIEAKNMKLMRKEMPTMINEVEAHTGMRFKEKPRLIFSHPAPKINGKYYYACSVEGKDIIIHSKLTKNKAVLKDYVKHELVEAISRQNGKKGHKEAKKIESNRKESTRYAQRNYPNEIFYDNQLERIINTVKIGLRRLR